ncbi:MAG: hypothetical protein HWE08_13510 [Alphaproteobacteria bacterium]|nr:hypothetical protein [Alphaproteobacteria bacterium]
MAETTTASGSGTEASKGEGKSRLATEAERLKGLSGTLGEAAGVIAGIPGLGSLAKPFEGLSKLVGEAGGIVANVATAIEENKETGVVGQGLGVAETLLGALAAGQSGEGGEGGEGGEEGDSTLQKIQEKVSQLRSIWGEYYEDLFDKEGKLNQAKAKNLALEVGDVILGTKKMAAVRKALAIGNVIRSGAEAVMTAAASAPFPANLVPIAKAVALQASQLGIVKGQAHDGLDKVPSTGTYLLEKGERVVDRRLNRDLSDYLRLQGGSTVNSRENTVNNSPSISLTINGNASADAVESNRGALEGMIRDIFADYALEAPF